MVSAARTLLSVVELGGYPNFARQYVQAGFEVVSVNSMRKAISAFKKLQPQVVVAEFNFQSNFRDRVSNLESLLARIQGSGGASRVIVFCEKEHAPHLQKLRDRFPIFAALYLPVDPDRLREVLKRAARRGIVDTAAGRSAG
jgi:DNA-binding NtrC family response regulator